MQDQSGGRLVAVIEDDNSARSALGRLLLVAGWEPILFQSAETFLAAGSRDPWCSVVIDVQLSGMSGIDLQRKLHADGVAVPIIMITGNRSTALRERAEREGCAAFLLKPFGGDELLSVLEAVGDHSAT